jgi:GT2 family glycosyltransferase
MDVNKSFMHKSDVTINRDAAPSASGPFVQIVILNWNSLEDTLRCIESLERQTYPNVRITVVDNGSADDLSSLDSRFNLIRLPANLGYTGGNNHAMRDAFAHGADYVWLFNNDATAEPDTLTKLIAACEADPTIGLASPLVREQNDHARIGFACGLFDLSIASYRPTADIAEARQWHAAYPDRIALWGTAMLVTRSMFETAGELDDQLFAYWEDLDYSIRSTLSGFRNVTVFETSIFHPSKPTIIAPDLVRPHYYYYMARNEILLWRKFGRGQRFLKSLIWILHRQLRQIQRMPNHVIGQDAVLAGLWDGWRDIGGLHDPKRRMPFLLRKTLSAYPTLWIRLMDAMT